MATQQELKPCYNVTVWGPDSPIGGYIECGVSLNDFFNPDYDFKDLGYSSVSGIYTGDREPPYFAIVPSEVAVPVAQPQEQVGESRWLPFLSGLAIGAILCVIFNKLYPRKQGKSKE
jgi:hypothetical protein